MVADGFTERRRSLKPLKCKRSESATFGTEPMEIRLHIVDRDLGQKKGCKEDDRRRITAQAAQSRVV